MMGDKGRSVLDDERIGRLLVKLTIPAFFGMFVMTLYNVVDTIFIGHYVGPIGIAGLSIVFPIQMLAMGMGEMTGMGGASLISRLLGKGEKESFIPFSQFTRKELTKYIKHHRPDLCKLESPYLFPSSHGHRVRVNSIQQAIKRLAKKAGLHDVACHPHIFRHTFATMFLAKGGNAVVLKDIMGHESVQTTQKYIHFQPEDLQKQHWKYSPVEDLSDK